MSEWILALLMALPSHGMDRETGEVREERMRVVATAIEQGVTEAEVAEPREIALLLVTTGFFESAFALHVHAGKCRTWIGECDHGRARSPWQLQSSGMVPREDWLQMQGTDLDSTRLAAFYAAKVLSNGWGRCGSREGALAAYATGKSCRWSGAKKRLQYAERLRRMAVYGD